MIGWYIDTNDMGDIQVTVYDEKQPRKRYTIDIYDLFENLAYEELDIEKPKPINVQI